MRIKSNNTTHKDFLVGVYHHGHFHPYGSREKVRAEFDPNYDPEIAKITGLAFVRGDVPIHGSFKDGKFRPAERETNRRGYVRTLSVQDGNNVRRYDFDFHGFLYEPGTNDKIGYITEGGEVRMNQKRNKFGLDSRLNVFLLFLLSGLVLSISSLSTTGNVVGSLMRTTPGLLGIFLFVFGLTGIFLNRAEKGL